MNQSSAKSELTSSIRRSESPVDLLPMIVALKFQKVYPAAQSSRNHLVPDQFNVRHSAPEIILTSHDALKRKMLNENQFQMYSSLSLLTF